MRSKQSKQKTTPDEPGLLFRKSDKSEWSNQSLARSEDCEVSSVKPEDSKTPNPSKQTGKCLTEEMVVQHSSQYETNEPLQT